MSDNKEKVILIIEDDKETAGSISRALTGAGYKTFIVSWENEVNPAGVIGKINLAIISAALAGHAGPVYAYYKIIQSEKIPVIFIADSPQETEVIPAGAFHYGIIARGSWPHIITSAVDVAFRLYESGKLLSGSTSDYLEIFNSSSDALFVHDSVTGGIVDVNRTMLKMYGYDSKEEIFKLTVEDLSASDEGYNMKKVALMMKEALESESYQFEWKAKKKNGEVFWIEVVLHSVNIGGAARFIAAVRDISMRKKVEEELEKSENLYRAIFENTGNASILIEEDTTISLVNSQWVSLSGYSREEQEGRIKWTEFVVPEDLGRMIEYHKKRRENPVNAPWMYEFQYIRRNGEIRDIVVHVVMIPGTKRSVASLLDITDRKRAETALRESEEKFRAIIDLAPDAILLGSSEGLIIGANRRATELSGYPYDELMGRSISLLFSEEERKRVPLRYDLLKAGHVVRNERALTKKDGSTVFIEMNTKMMPDGTYQTFIRDMTEKYRFMDAVQQTDRLNSLGVLAGGIAHDFNNLLSGIFGYIEMARLKSVNDKTVSGYLDKAFTVFNRARDLTQQLLTFSRGGSPVRRTGDLGILVRESTSFALSGSNIMCGFEIDPHLKPCDFDENQMGQVIDNVIINAKQAMPLGGRILISASNCRLEHEQVPLLGAGDYVKISISDTGIGIPPDIIKRIYDPFFTTKQQGNGLGLATAYSIIRNHDGYIEAESVPGHGTTIYIYLPVSLKGGDIYTEQSGPDHMGSGRILVMDDEEFIREIASEILSDMGYTVTCAADGTEALRFCNMMKDAGEQFDAAFFDLTIPGGMGGKEAVAEIRNICPEMPVFASSGFSDDHIMSHPVQYGFTASIRKPYRREELAALLNSNLKNP